MMHMSNEILAKLDDIRLRMVTEATHASDNEKKQVKVEKKQVKNEQIEKKAGKQIQIFFPEDTAAMPTELTRAALFALIRRGRRKFIEWEKIASRADVELYYFGKQLDQADADLWLACLRIGRGVPLGQRIYTTATKLLREIGRAKSGASIRWLMESLDRLSSCSLRLVIKRNGKRISITTGMLKYGIEAESGRMYIRLDPEGATLFENLAYIGWEQRLSLSSNASKALQLYVSGHIAGKPHAVLLSDLASWMGYEGRFRQFRATLIHALDELANIGLICDYGIKEGPKGEVACWTRIDSDKSAARATTP